MSYNTQFTYEFDAEPSKALGIIPPCYRVSFKRKDYMGEVVNILVPHDNPYKKKMDGSSDSVNPTLIPEKATFELVCQEFWQAEAFHVSDDREIQVYVEVDYTGIGNAYEPHWMGWVLATDIKEPYGPKPYVITIEASCGLSTLKDYPFLDSAGVRPSGWVSLVQALRICLNNGGPIVTLWTGYNLFELSDVAVGQTSGGLANPQTDPLYNTLVHAELFLTDDGATRTCWDVLEEILSARQLRLAQVGGQWWALRWPEMGGNYDKWNSASNNTIHVREYASPGVDDVPINHYSIDLNVYTDPEGPVAAKEGSSFIAKEEVGVLIKQTFGRHLNKLGDFSQVDSTGLPFSYYVNNLQVANRFREGLGTEVDPYRMVIYDSGDEKFNNDTPYIMKRTTYQLQSPEYTRFMKRSFKGRCRLTNIRAGKLVFVAVRDDGSYLFTGGDWVRSDKLKAGQAVGVLIYHIYKDQAGHDKALPGWFDYTVDLGTIDRVINLEVYYCMGEALDHYDNNGYYDGPETGQSGVRPKVEYQAGTLEVEQQGFVLDAIQKTIVKPGKVIKEPTQTINLGDVPDLANPYDRVGATFRRSTKTTTTLWYLANQAIGSNGQNASLGRTQLTIIAEDLAHQTMPAVDVWTGTIYGVLRYGAQTVLRIGDIGETVSDVFTPYARLLADISTDYRTCESEVVAPRLMGNVYALPVAKSEWETPDGLIPVEIGTDSTPVPPAEKPFTSPGDELKIRLKGLGISIPLPRLNPVVPGFVPLEPSAHPRPTLTILPTSTTPAVKITGNYRAIVELPRHP